MKKHHLIGSLFAVGTIAVGMTIMVWQTVSEAATPGVVGYWSFDAADVSGTSALDRSGSGHNLTINGSKAQVTGKFGQALQLNASEMDDLTAVIPDAYRANSNSFAVWVKPQKWGGDPNIHVFNWLAGSHHDYTDALFVDPEGIVRLQYPGISFGTSKVWVTDIDIDTYPLNQWLHMALVQNTTAKTFTLYLNGSAVDSATYTGTVDLAMHDTLKVFDRGGSTTAAATFDEMYIFSKALTATEVTSLYNGTYTMTTPTPPPAPSPLALTITASPTTINSGGSSTLSWQSTSATSCSASGGWTGSKAVSGSQAVSAITQTTTYTLTCTAASGATIQRSATVTVSAPSPTPTPAVTPTLTFTAANNSVPINGSTTLNWTATNAASCTATGGWSGTKPVSGSFNTGALSTNTNYTLTCKAPDPTPANWFNQSYAYRKKLTVDNTKVAGTGSLANYPILVALTDASLKSTANGGKITSNNGFDLIFTDGANSTQLAHEIESYNPATGALEAWVRVPSLSCTADTDLFMYYGNSAVTASQENTTALWSAYEGVWHLNNDFTDSAKTHHGTNNGTVDDIGVVGRARDFSDDSIRIPDGTSTALDASTNMTISTWIKPDAPFTSWNKFLSKGDSASLMSYEMLVDTDGGGRPEVAFHSSGTTGYAFSTVTMATNDSQWYHVTSVKTGNDISIFTNGNQTENWTQAMSGTPRAGTHDLYFGSSYDGWGSYFNGDIDEVRIAKSNLSADWINTDYQTITAKGAGTNKFLRAPGAEESRTVAGGGETVTKSVTVTVSSPSITAGLTGHWTMDTADVNWSSAGAEVLDKSGKSLHGDAIGMTSANSRPGAIGQSLFFDGTDDNVQVPDNALLEPSGDMTLALWVKLDQTASQLGREIVLIDKSHGSTAPWYSYILQQSASSDKIIFQWVNAAQFDRYADSTAALAAGQWYHLTAVKNGDVNQLYINGEISTSWSATSTGSILNSLGSFIMGGNGGINLLKGQMDDVRLYSRALSSTEVGMLYDQLPAPSLAFTASNTAIAYGASATLNWSATAANTCTASGAWSGVKAVSGSLNTGALTATKTYTLECNGIDGTKVNKSVTISVTSPPPTLTLSAAPTAVPSGGSTTLNWESTHTNSCTASNGWTGTKAVSGSEAITAITAAKSFVLTCAGKDGTNISKTVNITVIPAPTLSFSADKTAVATGGSATLSWSSTSTDSCTASDGWTGTKPLSGNATTGALSASKRYVLTCLGSDGSSVQKIVNISVIPEPELSLTITNDPVPEGQPAQLSWNATAVTACMASDGWTGTKTATGTASSGPLSADTVFTLTCTGQDGSTISKSATAHVVLKPKLEFSASKMAVAVGETTTLTWFAANVSSCTASGAWNGIRALSGSEVTYPIKVPTTFKLDCLGTDGSGIQKIVTITIDQPNITIFPGICHAYTNEGEFPVTQSYSPPYNVHSEDQELLMNVSCSENGITSNLGNGENSLYVYDSGYLYVDNTWTAIKYEGLSRVANTWLRGNGTLVEYPLTKSQLIKPSLLLGYFCHWDGFEWKCGCKNSACTNSLWSLQGFQADYQLN